MLVMNKVASEGFEPSILSAVDFKSTVYTIPPRGRDYPSVALGVVMFNPLHNRRRKQTEVDKPCIYNFFGHGDKVTLARKLGVASHYPALTKVVYDFEITHGHLHCLIASNISLYAPDSAERLSHPAP
jgi:hypothetical protein